ncbi:hypothetical protein CEXT_190561 [Caerostris extrusa]|uniref:Uncharacterized protein n=1 Tax=Caerostris extrusa TaxID=172846 RepID=A0AAV4MIH5_CAEEX|nr:hypothetical protein CEXT_190561 [Caerostris extrusa]
MISKISLSVPNPVLWIRHIRVLLQAWDSLRVKNAPPRQVVSPPEGWLTLKYWCVVRHLPSKIRMCVDLYGATQDLPS